MGPDGGIARIRVHGEVVVRTDRLPRNADLDLAAVEVGGLALACSNKHYGHPRNLIVPGRGNCMGDGWETARQPLRPPVYEKGSDGLMVLPGFEWALLQLGQLT
jgi:allantoicase